MAKTTKTLLIVSLLALGVGLAFITGLVNVENQVTCYIALPLGAVFLGLFLISMMLEKETAHFDKDQATLFSAAGSSDRVSRPK
jgi:hypothetical protein